MDMKNTTCVVTGAAGFIGHTLCHAMLSQGITVVGIDNFCDYYDPAIKKDRIVELQGHENFTFDSIDLAVDDLTEHFADAHRVIHLAGQPGVRTSWRSGFSTYTQANVLATQRVLEACDSEKLERFVYASSSSVYGNHPTEQSRETDPTHPYSPYGVTKLAGEHLACLYAENFGLPTVSLRFFTVYGPGQRPEMAMARMIDLGLEGKPFQLMTSPETIRDFTYVDDVVQAVMLSAFTDGVESGSVFNVCGGSPSSMGDVMAMVDEFLPHGLTVESRPHMPGDVDRTGGSSEHINSVLGWSPQWSLRSGIEAQVKAALAKQALV